MHLRSSDSDDTTKTRCEQIRSPNRKDLEKGQSYFPSRRDPLVNTAGSPVRIELWRATGPSAPSEIYLSGEDITQGTCRALACFVARVGCHPPPVRIL